jgi:hypothetical protein
MTRGAASPPTIQHILQQAQYKIARVTGLLHEDHTDLIILF